MATFLIFIILAVLFLFAVRGAFLRMKGGCCEGSGQRVKKVKAADRNAAHYPYKAVLEIKGMTCEHCVRRVEHALNRLDGAYAEAELRKKEAVVHMRMPLTNRQLFRAVSDAGYTLVKIKK
ncbi:heavy-metal-associated domain-containing protein [Sporolactobacillus sp. CPB3-1]|uniref:Heavy-metal-associated domain-containing protein n=1 Tax=Sporolactobacillus mangiferae TaxID=2940498 RepID=A0ABT0MDL9_9BACL|nr:heavy-metal-associated domain-containing protein [Sporolactobacillus mangiferae]MCL1632964.1 heavy-metal-associated domain-containing protein [Sporolactobacillus mangiferae]